MPISGDGFVRLADGSQRWGRFGAAGVLERCADEGSRSYFLARRSEWCHQGGCWAIPGGALHQGESPVDGALREFAEEVGMVLTEGEFSVAEVYQDDHGGWSYWTVVIDVVEQFAPPAAAALNWETAEAGWVSHDQLVGLDLHGAFRRTLIRLAVLPAD